MPDIIDYSIAFIVDTESYAGNWERELFSYMTGKSWSWEYSPAQGLNIRILEFNEDMEFNENGENPGEEILKELKENLTENIHDEYGSVGVTLARTPGRINNGNGESYNEEDVPEGVPHCASYESIAMFFHNMPSAGLIEFLKKRAYAYEETGGFKVTGFRIKQKISETKETKV